MIKLIRRRKHQRGQSLVEFALTSMMVVFLLISIIELARILHAYLTIQYAARQAARYAVTGQRMGKYVTDPTAGWQAGTSNIMKTIPPCWPRFPNDPLAPVPNAPTLFEPYRNARTCSIEEQALQAMRPLSVRPQAGRFNDPNCRITDPNQRDTCPGFYEVTVSSRVDDWAPSTGTFQRGSPPGPVNYSDFYPPAVYPANVAEVGAVNGFGGRPLDKVVIRIRFNHPIMTPFLSGIVPYVPLQVREEVVNESFGSTSLQRDPVLPPELPPIPDITGVEAPDLMVTSFTINGSSNIDMGDPVTFDITVANQGLLSTSGGYVVKVYASPTPLTAEAPITLSGTTVLMGSATMPAIIAGTQATVAINNAIFNTTGPQYLYAWVDADSQVAEDLGGLPNREKLNVADMPVINVNGGSANLALTMTVNPTSARVNDVVNYFVRVQNPTSFNVGNVKVTVTIPTQMAFNGAVSGCADISGQVKECTINVTPNSSSGVTIPALVASGSAGTIITTTAQITQIPTSFVDPVTSNNSTSANVVVDGVDLDLQKTASVTSASPGQTVTYTITVTNLSTATTATGVMVTDVLPPPSQVTVVALSLPAICSGTTTITCNVGTLAPGASIPISFQAQLSGSASGSIVNTASVTAAQPEAYTANNQDIAPIAVSGSTIADTAVTVSADVNGVPYTTGNLVKEGDILRFKVTLTNNGPFDATNLAIDNIAAPTGKLFYLSSAADSGTYNSGTGRWTVPSLLYQGTTTLTLRYRVVSGSAGQSMSLTSTISSSTQTNPDTSGNNSATMTVPVSAAANLVMGQTVSVSSVQVGQTVTFTLTVGNGGPSTATNIVVLTQDLVNASASFTIQNAIANFGTVDSSYRWTIPSLPYGATAKLELSVSVIAMPSPNPFTNLVRIDSLTEIDTDTTNNTASVTLQVTP